MAANDKPQDLNPDEERAYKEILAKEIMEKVKDKIESNDPNVVKTIKAMLDDDKPKK